MKIELRLSDDTIALIHDEDDCINIDFSRWQYEQGSDRNYVKHNFIVQFKTDSDLNQFFQSLKLISKEFNIED